MLPETCLRGDFVRKRMNRKTFVFMIRNEQKSPTTSNNKPTYFGVPIGHMIFQQSNVAPRPNGAAVPEKGVNPNPEN